MHHQDHNVHVSGFRFPKPEVWPRATFNALRPLRWLAIVLAVLAVLGCIGVHP